MTHQRFLILQHDWRDGEAFSLLHLALSNSERCYFNVQSDESTVGSDTTMINEKRWGGRWLMTGERQLRTEYCSQQDSRDSRIGCPKCLMHHNNDLCIAYLACGVV